MLLLSSSSININININICEADSRHLFRFLMSLLLVLSVFLCVPVVVVVCRRDTCVFSFVCVKCECECECALTSSYTSNSRLFAATKVRTCAEFARDACAVCEYQASSATCRSASLLVTDNYNTSSSNLSGTQFGGRDEICLLCRQFHLLVSFSDKLKEGKK